MTRARQQLTLLAHRQRPSGFVAQLGYAESTGRQGSGLMAQWRRPHLCHIRFPQEHHATV